MAARSSERKPNIVILYPDSLGANAVGCYGCKVAKTPNIDALARSGAQFLNCYSQNPVCMPSRASLHTGKYVGTHQVYDNGVKEYPEGHVTLCQALKGQGYRAAYFGKTHSVDQSQWDEVFDLYPDYNNYLRGRGIDVVYPEKPGVASLNAGISKIPAEDFSENVLGNIGASFIRRSADSGQPFFLFMSFEAPHSPWTIPASDKGIFSPDEMPIPQVPFDIDYANKPADRVAYYKKRARLADSDEKLRYALYVYHTLAHIVDRNVGKIVEAVKESGMMEDTIFIVCADHGDLLGNHRSMGKILSLEDSLIHVPLIVSCPARLGVPVRRDEMVMAIDLFPTIMDMAGAPAPDGLQGRSLLPLIRNESDGSGFDVIFSEEHNFPWTRYVAARDRRYKYIFSSSGTEELYDTKTDPYEWDNRTSDPSLRDVKDSLRLKLMSWHFGKIDRTLKSKYDWVGEFMKNDSALY